MPVLQWPILRDLINHATCSVLKLSILMFLGTQFKKIIRNTLYYHDQPLTNDFPVTSNNDLGHRDMDAPLDT